MFEAISSVAWWPSLKTDVYAHCKYCSLCMGRVKAKRMAGTGIIARKRHRHLTGDHVILPPWLVEVSGCGAIFVMMDLATGEMEATSTVSTGAEEAVFYLFNLWCRTRGLFLTFGSDRGSAFVSKVMEIFLKLLGVKVHRFSAVDDSRGNAHVERKNRLIREMESEISENSGVSSRQELETFITRYLIKYNQVRSTGGSTVFERCRGEPALSIGDLLTSSAEVQHDLDGLGKEELAFVRCLAKTTSAMMADFKVEQLVRARDNVFTRDSAESARRNPAQDFEKGQRLSLHGKVVVVVDLEGFDGETHLIATVREEGSTVDKRVKCQDLREMCWGRPQWSPQQTSLAMAISDFILFSSEGDEFNRGGLVRELSGGKLIVHEYCANDKRTRWLPLWNVADRKEKAAQKCPDGYSELLAEIDSDDVMLVGKLKGMVLSDNTKRRARAKGFDWALPSARMMGESSGA